MSQPRTWISNANPAASEVVRVRALIEHPMESGLRLDAEGNDIPRNIVNTFEAALDGELLFRWQPETAISQNPYIEFTFTAHRSGELQLKWLDDEGAVITDALPISLAS